LKYTKSNRSSLRIVSLNHQSLFLSGFVQPDILFEASQLHKIGTSMYLRP